jgi:predicted nucleic acid-binding protein
MRVRVLDSWAVLAFLQDEPAAEQIEAVLADSQESARPALISTVNLGEVWYQLARRKSEKRADEAILELQKAGLRVAGADWALVRLAAHFKAKYSLAYADCFAAALAKREGGEVLTGDPEFRQLEQEIKVRWLPRGPIPRAVR